MLNKLGFLALASSLSLAACGGETTEPDGPQTPDDIPRVLGAGEKADNFLSASAQEYFVRGTTTVELGPEYADASEEDRLARAQELVPYKQVVIGWFLNAYLIDKSNDADNAEYGGMKALTKNDSYESLNIRHVEGDVYAFDFVQEIGGQHDLLAELGEEGGAVANEDGTWTMELTIGKVSTQEMLQLEYNNEWYRSAPWSSFNPAAIDAERLETLELNLEEQEPSTDAWIDYPRLVEDGTVDISVFFGWDYHGDYHRVHSRATFNYLVGEGFEAPTGNFDEYATNRGALTKTLMVRGEPVEYRVTLWWGEPGTDTDADTAAGGILLEDEMRAAFARDEVIMFSGHSGPFYGFALANWKKTPEGDLDDSEIRTLEMPRDKYQIVLAEGCDTYALGEAFWSNPNKSAETSLDIITTTSFSDAGSSATVTEFLNAVAGDDGNGNLQPMTYTTLLEDLDNNSYWFDTMYGVHGIDDNPKSDPLADTDQLCLACSSDGDCLAGGSCVAFEDGAACTYECTSDAGCPSGYVCQESETDGWLSANYCVPETLTCG